MTNRECWLDLRGAGDWRKAVIEEAIHQGFEVIVSDDPADLEGLPPTVMPVLAVDGELRCADGERFATRIDVTDAETLRQACERSATTP